MIISDTKLDEAHSARRVRPENRDELAAMQRVMPEDLPATHVWEYRWEPPSEEELARNRYLLPTLACGPRELGLAEIAGRTKDFETLGHGELRSLFDRHKVKAMPLDPKAPRADEVEGLRKALRAHLAAQAKAGPAEAGPGGVQATRGTSPATAGAGHPLGTGPIVLPPDIAAMDKGGVETAAATLGVHDDWRRVSGKPIQVQRDWLARQRLAAQAKAAPAEAGGGSANGPSAGA